MFDMNLHYNRPLVPPIVTRTGDQTCTFQFSIPTGDLSNVIGMDMNHLVGMALKGHAIFINFNTCHRRPPNQGPQPKKGWVGGDMATCGDKGGPSKCIQLSTQGMG